MNKLRLDIATRFDLGVSSTLRLQSLLLPLALADEYPPSPSQEPPPSN